MNNFFLITTLLFCFTQASYSQNKRFHLSLMQGIWENLMNTESEKAYTVIRENFSLNFVFSNDSNEFDFPLNESIEGFQDYDSGNLDSININTIKWDGSFYTIVDKKFINSKGWVIRPFYLTPNYFECDGVTMSVNGGKLVEYEKINKLPNDALKKLYFRGKIDKRDYLKEYLGIKVAEITTAKSTIYAAPDKTKTTQLSKGDVITILEIQGNLLKVDYGENDPGWIKKEDIK